MSKDFVYSYETDIDQEQLVQLFSSVEWKSWEFPNRLYHAIRQSDYVISVWNGEELIALLSAITDGYINVFITYLVVKPIYQKCGIGKTLMKEFCEKFEWFGRRILTANEDMELYYNKFWFSVGAIAMFNKDWKEDC